MAERAQDLALTEPLTQVMGDDTAKKDRLSATAEVGAGLGLVGLTAAAFGRAGSVTFLDREPIALHCALSSAAVNNLPRCSSNHFRIPRSVSAAMFDWSEPTLPAVWRPVEVVLGADCLYDPQTAASLARTAAMLLGPEGGEVMLAEPKRERAVGCYDAFREAALEAGAVSCEVGDWPVSPDKGAFDPSAPASRRRAAKAAKNAVRDLVLIKAVWKEGVPMVAPEEEEENEKGPEKVE